MNPQKIEVGKTYWIYDNPSRKHGWRNSSEYSKMRRISCIVVAILHRTGSVPQRWGHGTKVAVELISEPNVRDRYGFEQRQAKIIPIKALHEFGKFNSPSIGKSQKQEKYDRSKAALTEIVDIMNSWIAPIRRDCKDKISKSFNGSLSISLSNQTVTALAYVMKQMQNNKQQNES